uniref:AraC family transcriptional regulator n=1 Tax=Parascaris equorum TaxID=6256 RepID=A0A914RKM1_PAREQ
MTTRNHFFDGWRHQVGHSFRPAAFEDHPLYAADPEFPVQFLLLHVHAPPEVHV